MEDHATKHLTVSEKSGYFLKLKKHKKKKRKRSSSSEYSSSGSGSEWVEAPGPSTLEKPKEKVHHEDWMNNEEFVSTFGRENIVSGRQRRREAEDQKRKKDMEIQQKRELNPTLKAKDPANSDVLPSHSVCVGDGGYSFLRKAYTRVQEQAKEEGRSLEEVAAERWGSLDQLLAKISEAESQMHHNAKTRYKDDHHRSRLGELSSRNKEHYKRPLDDHKSRGLKDSYSIKFEKPKHSERRKNHVNQFSSSGKYSKSRSYENSRHHSDSDQEGGSRDKISSRKRHGSSDDSDDEHYGSKSKLKEIKNSEEKHFRPSFDLEKDNSSDGEKHVPRWKKIKASVKTDQKTDTIEEQESSNSLSMDVVQTTSSNSSSMDVVQTTSSNNLASTTLSAESDIIPMSQNELNHLASKFLKADLMGDKELAAKLKAEYDVAKANFQSSDAAVSSSKERVLLTKAGSSGMIQPVTSSREEDGFNPHAKHNPRNKFFDDGSKYSLKQMFEREKLTTADDNLEMFMDVAGQCRDDARDDTETGGISKKAVSKMANVFQEEKDVKRAMQQHQKISSALQNCRYCINEGKVNSNLIISVASKAFLSVPGFQSIVNGHCLIIPKRHVSSFIQLDEDEYNETEEFKKKVRRYFKQQDKTVLFLETSYNFRSYPHAFVECIPVDLETGDLAPLYFKKAIQECEDEWANNVKLVDLRKKDLRHSIPRSLPYLCIQFDPSIHPGYAHVIEDERKFPKNFGKEVIGGMMDIDYNRLYKNRREDEQNWSTKASEFKNLWKTFFNTI